MDEADRQARNTQRLGELYPAFGARLELMLGRLEAAGLRPRIQDGWRSPIEQLKAFETGRSKLRFGFHNVTGPDGAPESLAADVLDDDHPLDPPRSYLLQLAAAAEAEGLTTGIRWGLPSEMRAALDAAIADEEWGAEVRLGWDPTHVEAVGVSVSAARMGARPQAIRAATRA